MKEVWKGHYLGRPFRIVVSFGKIIQAEGAPTWAKGMRIRHFKRTIWKGHSYIEREEPEKSIEAPPVQREEPEDQKSGEDAEVVSPVRTHDPVPEVRETSMPDVRPSRKPLDITSGMNLRNALQIAHKLGCSVQKVRRSGEVRISHPSMKKRINADCRKKRAPRPLTTFLKRVQELEPQ